MRYKTQLCTNFMTRGKCAYNKKCQFAHGEEELNPKLEICPMVQDVAAPPPVPSVPDHCKRGICFAFRDTGECRFGNSCKFEHVNQSPAKDEQLRKTHLKFRTPQPTAKQPTVETARDAEQPTAPQPTPQLQSSGGGLFTRDSAGPLMPLGLHGFDGCVTGICAPCAPIQEERPPEANHLPEVTAQTSHYTELLSGLMAHLFENDEVPEVLRHQVEELMKGLDDDKENKRENSAGPW